LSTKPRILFVSHAATRNGATILLLNTLRWLKARNEFEIEILVHGKGELLGEFEAIGRTTVWRNPAGLLEGFPRGIREKCMPGMERAGLQVVTAGRRWDLLYVNTAAVWRDVASLAKRSRRVLWHIHEMSYALRLVIGEERARELFGLASRFVVVSESVRDALRDEFGVEIARMDVINGSVPFMNVTGEMRAERRRAVLKQLGWPEKSFVVGACGAMGWRKGTDVFLQIAREMLGKNPDNDVRFLWIGGEADGDEALRFKLDARLLGVEDCCRSLPTTGNVMDYYMTMDAFALTSRDVPYRLVLLEAVVCQVPTVCFAQSGGGPEYVGGDAGLIAPYLDVPAFAAHLETLRKDPEMRAELGAAAAEKVRTRHVIETQGPKILTSIHCSLAS